MLYCSNAVARKKGRQVGEIQCKGANRSGAPVQRCKGETRRGIGGWWKGGRGDKGRQVGEIQCKGANRDGVAVQKCKGGKVKGIRGQGDRGTWMRYSRASTRAQ